jgi:hypothetical protein
MPASEIISEGSENAHAPETGTAGFGIDVSRSR